MNILHVGDMAGVASITANICSKLGHPSVVIRDDGRDSWNHGDYYGNTLENVDFDTMIKAIEKCIDSYDHIVYHDRYNAALALDHYHKPSSYMFHGNMLRQNPRIYDDICNLESVDNMFVTTEDLLRYAPEAKLFHRPVDMELFNERDIPRQQIGLCLTQDRYLPFVRDMLRGNETGIFIMDRVKNNVNYEEMGNLLNSYSVYYDIKYQPTHPPTMIEELSQTGLQALACGIPVWSCGKWHSKFPEEHDDEMSAREFIKVLQE